MALLDTAIASLDRAKIIIKAATLGAHANMQKERWFPRKRLVKFCTRRFRGNVTNVPASAITIRADARSAAAEASGPASGAVRRWAGRGRLADPGRMRSLTSPGFSGAGSARIIDHDHALGRWDKAEVGGDFAVDFDLTYRKITAGQ